MDASPANLVNLMNMQQRMVSSISRSAVMILSSAFNRRLTSYFSASELLLVLVCMHTLLNTIRTVPGFHRVRRVKMPKKVKQILNHFF